MPRFCCLTWRKRPMWSATDLPPLSRRTTKALPADALKFAHEVDQGLHSIEADRVVQRGAHAADRAMARRAHQPRLRRFVPEFLLDGFIATGYAEDHVHARTRAFLDRAAVISAGIDGVVE